MPSKYPHRTEMQQAQGGPTHAQTFETVVGDIKFGLLGEWDKQRVLTVQFRDIKSSGIDEFRKPEARVVVAPTQYSSGALRTLADSKIPGGQ